MMAATIATYAAFLGFCVENYEPVSWAAELVEPARAVNHRQLAFLYVMATLCWFVGRIEEAVGYSDVGHTAMGAGAREVPFGLEGTLPSPYLAIGQPDRAVERCRALLALSPEAHANVIASLAMFLSIAGRDDEAMAATDGSTRRRRGHRQPLYALECADGLRFRVAQRGPRPRARGDTPGLAIAQASGNRFNESHLTANLAQLDAERGDPLAALDHICLAIRYMHDSGNTVTVRSPMANLAHLP